MIVYGLCLFLFFPHDIFFNILVIERYASKIALVISESALHLPSETSSVPWTSPASTARR
jgi:hypothetical protein